MRQFVLDLGEGAKGGLEWLLGVPPADAGQGTVWRFHHSFPWPGWFLLLFVIFSCVFVYSIYQREAIAGWRRRVLVGLRLFVITGILLFLAELLLTIERTGLPYVVILLDTSASMGTPDQYPDSDHRSAQSQLLREAEFSEPTRLNLAKSILLRENGELLKRLVSRHKVRIYTFADTVHWLTGNDLFVEEDVDAILPAIRELKASGRETRPAVALKGVINDLRGTPPASIIILSDGITSTGDADRLSAASELARSERIRLFPIGIGNDEPLRDLSLIDTLSDEMAFVGDPITVTTKLKANGLAGKRTRLELRNLETKGVLAQKEVVVTDGTTKLEMTYTPNEVGEFELELEIVPIEEEFRRDNNSEQRHLSVREGKLRVLLVEDQPRHEFRYLKHLLEREGKTIEFNTVLIDSDPEYAALDQSALPRIPVQREELFRYDVIIWGDIDPSVISPAQQETLKEFVRQKGGGVIMIAGQRHNPGSYRGTTLETLLPIGFEDLRVPEADSMIGSTFRPTLTADGSRGTTVFRFSDDTPSSLQIWNSLPMLRFMVEAPQLKDGAVVWATHPTQTGQRGKLPLFVWHRYGDGKVLFHATDETYLWRFRIGDRYFGRYWIQAIRFLARSSLVGKDRGAKLTADRKLYNRDDPVTLRLQFVDERQIPQEEAMVVVEQRGGAQRRIALKPIAESRSIFEGQLTETNEGSYHVWVESPNFPESPPTVDFQVQALSRESQLLRMDKADLSRAATRSVGAYVEWKNAQDLMDNLPEGDPVPLKTDDPRPVWNHPLWLMLFVLLLACEWGLRKRWQLT